MRLYCPVDITRAMIFEKRSPKSPLVSAWVNTVSRIIAAIGKHVIAKDTFACRNKGVGVDEAADSGVVITALQVIEVCFLGGELAILERLPDHP